MNTSAPAWRTFFGTGLTADGDNHRFVCRIAFNTPAHFDSINAGNHDVQDQQIGLGASDFDQGGDSVGSRTDLIAGLPLKKCLQDIDDFLFVFDDKDAEFAIDKRCGRRDLMPAKKRQKVFAPDAAMPARRAI